MKKSFTLLALIGMAIALSAIAPAQQKKIYPDRWVYANGNFRSDKDVEALIRSYPYRGGSTASTAWSSQDWTASARTRRKNLHA